MPSYTRYASIIIVLLLMTNLMIWKIYSKADDSTITVKNTLPLQLDNWTGQDIEVTKDVYEILETDDIIMREYTNPNRNKIYLAIVTAQKNRSSFHPPEICYAGSNRMDSIQKTKKMIQADSEQIKVNQLKMKHRKGFTKAYYWFQSGTKKTHNYYEHQFIVFMNLIQGKTSKESMVRISMDAKTEPEEKIMNNFLNALLPHV